MSKIFVLPALFALAFAFSGVAVAKAVPNAPLVTVHRIPSGRCLGTVVSDHQVITSAHCVVGGSGKLFVSSADGEAWSVESWQVAPDYPGDISDDIALLQIEEPIGRKLGSLRLYLGDLQDDEDLHVPVRRRNGDFRIGRSKARVFKTWFSTDRIVLKFKKFRARPGDSGAPVLRYRKGAYEVVGVLSACWGGEVVAAYIGEGGHRSTRRFLAGKVPGWEGS